VFFTRPYSLLFLVLTVLGLLTPWIRSYYMNRAKRLSR
jgi:hypothetical protein